jgi:hypothetical protein
MHYISFRNNPEAFKKVKAATEQMLAALNNLESMTASEREKNSKAEDPFREGLQTINRLTQGGY